MVILSQVSKSYGGLHVLDGLSLSLDEGRLVAILGPSGCGKTTLLDIVSGLERPDSGTVHVSISGRVGYMLQDSLLLPWRTLEQNALLGLETATNTLGAKTPDPRQLLGDFGLLNESHVYPAEASGGMKQRIALIRTLLPSPSILLLDEPFSNLDFDNKLKIQQVLIRLKETQALSIVVVTHDIDDAIAMADEVIVLTQKPTRVKKSIPIDFGSGSRDPVCARQSPKFANYFASIWQEIVDADNAA